MSGDLLSSHSPHMLSALHVSVGLTSCNSISIWKELRLPVELLLSVEGHPLSP